MAELTRLDEKIGEMLGVAMAAQDATDTVEGLADGGTFAEALQRMHEEAVETEKRINKHMTEHADYLNQDDTDRLERPDRLADRPPDLELDRHEIEWTTLPDGSEALLVDGGTGASGRAGVGSSPRWLPTRLGRKRAESVVSSSQSQQRRTTCPHTSSRTTRSPIPRRSSPTCLR